MSFDPSKDIIRTDSGDPIPQIWNDEEQIFVPYEGKVQLSGSIVVEGVRGLTGDKGQPFSFELDEEGIPVLRVYNVDPAGYNEENESIMQENIYTNNKLLFSELDKECQTGESSYNLGTVDFLGYSKYYVLVRTNTSHNWNIETYGEEAGTFGSQITEWETIISADNSNKEKTEHLEVIGSKQFFRIISSSGEPTANFDVFIYGVN